MDAVDWSAPWYEPWRRAGRRVHRAASLPEGLNDERAPVHFVAQSQLPPGTPYETFIFETGCCPVRENLHDLFNGLVWAKFPRAKQALNRLQAAEIARDGIAGARGPVRDAITVFDENGALLSAPPALWDALLERDWRRLFVELRPLWHQAQLVVFGHALLEKLVSPRKPMVAHVYQAPQAIKSIAALDGWLAQAMQPQPWDTKPFAPLPVLGVPGWWPGNEAPEFYADAQVFRPPR